MDGSRPVSLALVMALVSVLNSSSSAVARTTKRDTSKQQARSADDVAGADTALRPEVVSGPWTAALELESRGKVDEALKALDVAIPTEPPIPIEQRASMALAAGGIASRAGRSDVAVERFRLAGATRSSLSDYAHFFEATELLLQGNLGDARKAFDAALQDGDLPPRTELEARARLGQIASLEKNYPQARALLKPLMKRLRGTELEPEAVYHLYRAERTSAGGCKLARDLFTKFATLPETRDWGPDLRINKVDGIPTGCSASPKDVQARMRRLQWGGEPDRAVRELNATRASGEATEYGSDSMMANQLVNEGRVEEALQLLLAHYQSQRGRPGFQLLLAKAAARAGEYAAAIGAYDRAYKMKPRGADGRNALFQAAFMSYQAQDYDGALRRFEWFLREFSTASLARDSRWYLAWIRYLRGDFQAAYAGFEALEKMKPEPKRRRSRRSRRAAAPAANASPDAIGRDRLQYWKAMCLLRLGQSSEALPLLQTLARDPGYGFYGVLAHYRLTAMSAVPTQAKPLLSEQELKRLVEADADTAPDESVAAADEPADEPVDDSVDEAPEAGSKARVDVQAEAAARGQEATIVRRFGLARQLAALGFADHARRELAEIEARARSTQDRRALMQEYKSLGNYNRSSYLGETAFGMQRLRGGMQKERALWEITYPRAFAPAVAAAAKESDVPEELVWSIMRAESHYRPEAYSSVGAIGLMQMMPFTGKKVSELLGLSGATREFDPRSLMRPEFNIRLGARYLRRLSDAFQGSIPLVAAGYNAGPHRVQSWLASFGLLEMDEFIEHIPFVETRNYTKRVVRNFQIYELLYGNSKRSMTWLAQPVAAKRNSGHVSRESW